MKDHLLLEQVSVNNRKLQQTKAERILIVYDDGAFYLGDNCINFSRFNICKSFFGSKATVDVCCINERYLHLYRTFSTNNPMLNHVFSAGYENIPFEEYDLLLVIAYYEMPLLKALCDKYADNIDRFKVAVFTFSRLVLFPRDAPFWILFPEYEALLNFAIQYQQRTYEICMTAAERDWGNDWLEQKGLRADEGLVVLLDSSADRSKLLRLDVYADIIRFLAKHTNFRFLIFDEKGIGKSTFYKEWLGEEVVSRFIFSEKLSFRQDLCLLSADPVKLVLGPCTGLMHCASAIHNHFIRNGKPSTTAPLMIVYTGPWDAARWWSNAPLVKCLYVRMFEGRKKLHLLQSQQLMEKVMFKERLACSEFTADMITDFLTDHLIIQREVLTY